MKPAEWIAKAARRLENAPYGDADAKYLAQWVTGKEGYELRFAGDMDDDTLSRLESALRRRLAGEPVQYITGVAYFYGRAFRVDERVLIPQPDTETLVERVLARGAGESALDLCCGSGCIGLTIALESPGTRVVLADVDAGALDVARANSGRMGIKARFAMGDMLRAVPGERFDTIACNPPYIASGAIPALPGDVRREPVIALDGGSDGLDFYRVLAREAAEHLTEDGCLFAEIGFDQARDMERLFPGCRIVKDLGGNDRVMIAERKIVWGT